ncbi:helix-turn-helix domain-containing protein [Escherichia albertii]|uniref:helix-turn-helix domain-containing protein n=1 Tax=Escherichia albertii TaxID=208962 RepID=UPI00195E4430|nr:helix-turn-helix domain-containing protein [Escherichia albertii]QST27744.1 helix-turn-helix domain-containing protein [Escherichia albertii]QST37111.1 helix-turn-helix domain-containing protein [Escherichia albertii]
MSIIGTEQVLTRLKQVFAVTSDSALCERLMVSPQTLSSWKSRNKIPYANCVDVCQQKNVSLDWLITGRGGMYLIEQSGKSVDVSSYSHADLKLLELLNQLEPDIRKDLLRSAEEKQRVATLEKRLEELALELESLKCSA